MGMERSVIDPQGQVRVFLPANFDPKDLVTDMRAWRRGEAGNRALLRNHPELGVRLA